MNSLQAHDRFGLVSFSPAGRVESALQPLNEANRSVALAAITGLKADGQTNLWEGLKLSLDQLSAPAANQGRLKAVLLLTDGCPNVNPAEGHMPALNVLMN